MTRIPVLPGEEWRPVVARPADYQVSSLGRVWSRPRERTAGGIMRQVASTRGAASGRPIVTLAGRGWFVHTLVCEAFHGPRPRGLECRHLNGDMTDNRAENLRWGTHAENGLDTVRHGRHQNAVKTRCPRGHRYAGANLVRLSGGRRDCRACANRRSREYRARRNQPGRVP